MKISIKEIPVEEEEEVVIRCHEIDEDMLSLIQKLKAQQNSLTGISGEEIHRLRLQEIYYFEVVDNKSFFYCEDKIDFIRPSLSGRFEAVLGNKESVLVSRQYVLSL
ncbi:hypothetical protein [Kineothrix sedimenti]|uniref:LytTr DNA-binding domain-containing protein n=1 Tax=Kineothrix sedimenti TaxID=3123317 RepID=A0ABZ3F2G3_9FIRM